MEQQCLGDYDLIASIGLKGLGNTYLAEHRFLKRKVVLKVLEADSKEQEFLFNQIQKVALLSHPHLLKPLTVEKESGVVFIVQEPVLEEKNHAFSLQKLFLHHEELSEEMVYSILSQVAKAVDFLHEHKVQYVNIKLSNIFITNITKDDIQIVLSDYGLHIKNQIEQLSTTVLDNLYHNWEHQSTESKEHLIDSYKENSAFLAPEINAQEIQDLNLLDTYAFGVLSYYLLMRKVPGVLASLPSKKRFLRFDWDFLIQECLKEEAYLRPKQLCIVLQKIQKIKPTIVKHQEAPSVQEFVNEIQHQITTTKVAVEEPVLAMKQSSGDLKPVIKAQELIRPSFDPDPAQVFHIESLIAPYKPKEKEHVHLQPLQTDMIIVAEGEYIRGSNEGARDERPMHRVVLSSFAIDVHPVTNEQFVRFLDVLGGEKDSNNNDVIRLRESRIKRSAGKLIIESGYGKHPVVGVSWYGAVAYAKWVGKRLPSEAEWEVVSRSLKADVIYPTGVNIERTHANFFSADTTPVMSYPCTELGLYDMAGNVYEWCYDWYDYNFYESSLQEPQDPKGPAQGVYRVLRGGCWKSLKDDLRCAHRHRNNPGTVNRTYGFRCAADVE